MTKANFDHHNKLKDANFTVLLKLIKATTTEIVKVGSIRLHLHDVIYCPDSFVLMLHYCANLKAVRYKSMSFNRIIADKLHLIDPTLVISYQS